LKIDHIRRILSRAAMRGLFRHDENDASSNAGLSVAGVHRILLCRLVHTLGDALYLTPLIQEIDVQYPGAQIDIITASDVAEDIYRGYLQVKNLYSLPAHVVRHPMRSWRTIKAMRRIHYDLAIDTCTESQSGRLLTILANATHKLGYSDLKKIGYMTHPVVIPEVPVHKAQLPVYLLRAASCSASALSQPYPVLDIALSVEEKHRGNLILKRVVSSGRKNEISVPIIGVFANATGAKSFSSEWWFAFVVALRHHFKGYGLIEFLPVSGRSILGHRCPTYFFSNVRQLGSVISALSIFISPDCGVMHLASASGATTVGLFSVTDAALWGPYGPTDRAIITNEKSPIDVANEIFQRFGGQLASSEVVKSQIAAEPAPRTMPNEN
jgi:heptosyltransferase-3